MENEGFPLGMVVGAFGMLFLFAVAVGSCDTGRNEGRREACVLVCHDAGATFDAGRGCSCLP